VGALLRTWTEASAKVSQHSAAVRAYSTTLGGMFPRDAMRAVRVVTAGHSRLHFEAARVLEELFRSGLRDEVIDEMNRWLTGGGEEHELTAALALMLIALVQEHPEDDRPALLARFADAEADRRHRIGRLWRNALTCPEGVSGLAWDILRLWVEYADREPAALGPVGGLVEELSVPVGEALRFHLLWWRDRTISPGTAMTLLSHLTPRRGE
jgi:hypothetical protein